MRRGAAALAALAAGVAHTAGFAPTGWWPLQLAALAALAWLVREAMPLRAAMLGALFGLGWFVSGISWVYVSMHHYGAMPAPLAALATVAFAAYLALFPAAAAGLAAAVRAPPGLPRAVAFAAAWALSELARGWLLTGFPWLAAGYAHTDGPLAGWAPLAGVYGVSGAAALVAAAAAHALTATRTSQDGGKGQHGRAEPALSGVPTGTPPTAPIATMRRAWPSLLAALITLAGGALAARIDWTGPAGEPLRVRLVQGNVAQELKFDPLRTRAAMQRYVELIEQAPAPLTVLPETAWTLPWRATPAEVVGRLRDYVERNGAAVAIGMPLYASAEGAARISNSVVVLDGASMADGADAPAGRYDKRHLVPFGEFVPWGFRWFVDLMRIPLGDFARGAPRQPPVAVAGQRVAFNICYEDLFGEEIIGAVRDGATVLVNVSNIAWFGDSLALPQHLQISRMRALETGRPMLRATNTGTTAAIDARGRVTARLAPMTEGVLDADVVGHTGTTLFVRTGNMPAGALSAAALVLLAVHRRRRTRGVPDSAGKTGRARASPHAR